MTIRPFVVFVLCMAAASASLSALDLAAIAENDAKALRDAVEKEGGRVKGEPVITTATGPDGTATRVLSFPTPDSFVDLPISPTANFWKMSGAILVDEPPFTKVGGAMFGVLFGQNDSVLAIIAGKWSKVASPHLMSGANTLLQDVEFQEGGVPQTGAWQKILLALDGTEWKLQIGDAFSKSGNIEEDTRDALKRRTGLSMRIGTFTGSATLPDFTESQ